MLKNKQGRCHLLGNTTEKKQEQEIPELQVPHDKRATSKNVFLGLH